MAGACWENWLLLVVDGIVDVNVELGEVGSEGQ